jgi:hypothetical protein
MLQRVARFLPVSGLSKGFICIAVLGGATACAHENAGAPAESPATAAPPTSADPASTSAEPQNQGGASVFVVHLMSDYDVFKKWFDENAPEREKAGIKGYLVSRLDDGKVVIHLVADDLQTVEKAVDSPDLERFLDRKGQPDSSVVWLTKNDIVKLPATPPVGQTYSLYLKAHVGDFAALRSGFEERRSVFAEQGVIGEGLHSTTEGDVVILHFVGTARDKLEALPRRPEFVELMKQAGTKGDLKPLIGVDTARSRPN